MNQEKYKDKEQNDILRIKLFDVELVEIPEKVMREWIKTRKKEKEVVERI